MKTESSYPQETNSDQQRLKIKAIKEVLAQPCENTVVTYSKKALADLRTAYESIRRWQNPALAKILSEAYRKGVAWDSLVAAHVPK